MSIANLSFPNTFNLFCNSIQYRQTYIENFPDLIIAVGVNQVIPANTMTQLNNFTGEFGTLPGMDMVTGIFSPDLTINSGFYMWSL
jgi:hypothetical protein